MLQLAKIASLAATPFAELNIVPLVLGGLKCPVSAADFTVSVHIGELVAPVRIVDVEFLIASTDVVDFQVAAGDEPSRFVFDSEPGVGAQG